MELDNLIAQTHLNFGVNSVIQIRLNTKNTNASSSGKVFFLEKELLFRLKGGGRIIQHGNRLIFKFDNLAHIIRDLPDDEEKAGRLKDHF